MPVLKKNVKEEAHDEVDDEDDQDGAEQDESNGEDIEDDKSQKPTSKEPEPNKRKCEDAPEYPFKIEVGPAKTGRSKCCICCHQIAAGDMRVGVECFKSGRLCMGWNHPECYKPHVGVDHNTSGRGSCKVTKKGFTKGQLRFYLGTGPIAKAYISMDGLRSGVLTHLLRAMSLEPQGVKGFDALSQSDKDAYLSAMRGESESQTSQEHNADITPSTAVARENGGNAEEKKEKAGKKGNAGKREKSEREISVKNKKEGKRDDDEDDDGDDGDGDGDDNGKDSVGKKTARKKSAVPAYVERRNKKAKA